MNELFGWLLDNPDVTTLIIVVGAVTLTYFIAFFKAERYLCGHPG